MAQKSKGMRRKSRKKLTKGGKREGPTAKHLRSFEAGDRVRLVIDPSVHQGMPHPRFHGRTAEVVEQQGRSYVVTINDRGKDKQFPVYPAHLRAAGE